MFDIPMSSPIMTRMFGFFSCADTGSVATSPRTTRDTAMTRPNLPMRFMNFLLLLFLLEEKRSPPIFSIYGEPQTKRLGYPARRYSDWELSMATISRRVMVIDVALRRIFLEHFGDRFVHQLHIFLRVLFVQGALPDATPHQFFSFHVVNIDDQRAVHVLLRSNPAHSATDPAHPPGVVGGRHLHSTAAHHDQIRIL